MHLLNSGLGDVVVAVTNAHWEAKGQEENSEVSSTVDINKVTEEKSMIKKKEVDTKK